MIVRLLQTFDKFTIAQAEAAPEGAIPPPRWKEKKGRRSVEDCIPQWALTMYAKVGPLAASCSSDPESANDGSKGGLWLRMHVASA